ncbi:MAG: two-component system nitrogen regulation response regulator NtrX [bacterium]|jgi:two-component system nitrogen regulation response regulator NtrX
MPQKILIVDDESSIRNLIKDILDDEGYETQVAKDGESAKQILRKNEDFNVVLLDIWMPGIDGMQVLEWIKKNYSWLPVVMMSGHGNIETAVKATKKGAYDFIEKPLSLEKILITLSHALKESNLERENEELRGKQQQRYDIIGESLQIQEIHEQIKIAAPTNGWVLIHGENGTGKELVARQIHMQSLRKKKPFVEVNCAAIPEELIESELFGHEKGSFTGATTRKIGKFDQANGGTLFLDEIGDMSLKTQAKILRILQEQRFERVGGTQIIEVDVRIIAASNKDLLAEIEKGNFREDLYYRLNVIPLEVPPLKERMDDIPILVEYFLDQYSKSNSYSRKTMTVKAMNVLQHYNWPGNIRELKNIVERMVIMVQGSSINIEHIPPVIRMAEQSMFQVSNFPNTFREARESFDKQFLEMMLKKNNWNISKTAECIHLERSNLHKKIKLLDIVVPKN